MKNKLMISIMTLFILCCMFVGVGNVYALDFIPKAPSGSNIPDENQVLYAYLADDFDFDKISFSSTGNTTIVGMQGMRKIVLLVNPTYDESGNVTGYDDYFTVYCLDADYKYPQYSFNNLGIIGDDDEEKLYSLMSYSLFNHSSLANESSALSAALKRGYDYADNVSFETNLDSAAITAALNNILDGNTEIIDVKSVTYGSFSGSDLVLSAQDLTGDTSATSFPLEVKKSDILLDKYTTKILSDQNYNHALWILEHSFPTLGLAESLEIAGANYFKAIAEVTKLENPSLSYDISTITDAYMQVYLCEDKEKIAGWYGVSETDVDDGFCDAKLNEHIVDYVYSTVQYAIWKVNDGIDFNEKTLGESLIGSEELNKLYQYLITPRAIHNNYINYQFDNTLELVKPNKNEIFKETSDAYIYGPYSVNYSVLSMSDVTVSFTNPVNGATIVNELGNEITGSISPNEVFYIKCNKNDKITNLSIKIHTDNALTFENANKRGRIYYSYYPNSQNVISGGSVSNLPLSKSYDLVFNPKTGETDIAALFGISLILFSLVYIGISYKNKPVELS